MDHDDVTRLGAAVQTIDGTGVDPRMAARQRSFLSRT
jgi:hypothetical protein